MEKDELEFIMLYSFRTMASKQVEHWEAQKSKIDKEIFIVLDRLYPNVGDAIWDFKKVALDIIGRRVVE